jgi:hypothetical protein
MIFALKKKPGNITGHSGSGGTATDKDFRIPKKFGVPYFCGHFKVLPNFLDTLRDGKL